MPGSIDFEHVRRLAAGEGGYFVLEGSGALGVEGETVRFNEGQAVFVPAAAEHRFTGDEHLSVLAIFAQPNKSAS